MEQEQEEYEMPEMGFNINAEYVKTTFELLHRAQMLHSRGNMGAYFHTLKVAYESIEFKLESGVVKNLDKCIVKILTKRKYWDMWRKGENYGETPRGVTMREINIGKNEFSYLVVKFQRKLLRALKEIEILS